MDAPHELGDLHDRDNGGPDGPLNGVASELRATSSSNGFGERITYLLIQTAHRHHGNCLRFLLFRSVEFQSCLSRRIRVFASRF
jgi:hypothetical protein